MLATFFGLTVWWYPKTGKATAQWGDTQIVSALAEWQQPLLERPATLLVLLKCTLLQPVLGLRSCVSLGTGSLQPVPREPDSKAQRAASTTRPCLLNQASAAFHIPFGLATASENELVWLLQLLLLNINAHQLRKAQQLRRWHSGTRAMLQASTGPRSSGRSTFGFGTGAEDVEGSLDASRAWQHNDQHPWPVGGRVACASLADARFDTSVVLRAEKLQNELQTNTCMQHRGHRRRGFARLTAAHQLQALWAEGKAQTFETAALD